MGWWYKPPGYLFGPCVPVQVQQDKEDATSIVDKRLEYITSEMKRLDKQLTDIEEKQVPRPLAVGG